MTPALGQFSLFAALGISLILAVLSAWAKHTNTSRILSAVLLCAVVVAFFTLVKAHAFSDFSVLNVYLHSHTTKPLIYKIAGAWGNHEGSMLLWIGSMALFTFLFTLVNDPTKPLISTSISIQCLLIALFTVYVIYASNPFERLFPPPIDGLGLNAILQDLGLALHPPVLYIGYVGFSLGFSIAIATLLVKKIPENWSDIIRPWIMLSWLFLTAGIGLGSWWAYRELGWGGYWYWDPVENASLIPWLTATALFHTLLISKHYKTLYNLNILLAILTFAMSLIGTFLVRSGIITSVHTFATDPYRGIFILLMLITIVGTALLIYALRAKALVSTKVVKLSTLPRLIALNATILILASFIVLFGTIYPLIVELLSHIKITVAAPYFNSLISPLAILLCALCIFGSQVRWDSSNKLIDLPKYKTPFLLVLILSFITFFHFRITSVLSIIAIFASFGLVVTIIKNSFANKFKAPSKYYGMLLAHLGFAIIILAIAINTSAKKETEIALEINERINFMNFEIRLTGLDIKQEKNYIARVARIEVIDSDKYVTILTPEIRYFPVEAQQTIESSISHKLLYDFYVTMGEMSQDGKLILRLHYLPMIGWIWFGCILICFGAIFSLLLQIVALGRYDRDKQIHKRPRKFQRSLKR